MAKNSNIAWTDHTWNPWQGCHKVSDGCKYCYMYRDKKRYGQDADVVVRSSKATFNKPLTWKYRAKVFVCSWSDFFIEEADPWRGDAYEIMWKTWHLTYLLLTKRPERINASNWPWPFLDNVWLGVTAENQDEANKRIPILLQIPAQKRFLSIEPMLGPVDLTYCGNNPYYNSLKGGRSIGMCAQIWSESPEDQKIDWVIIGAESGPNARLMDIEWARDIVRQCKEAGVACFVKQLHINNKLSTNIEEWPEDLRIQEFPKMR